MNETAVYRVSKFFVLLRRSNANCVLTALFRRTILTYLFTDADENVERKIHPVQAARRLDE